MGTIFGGSPYGALDPIYMIMLIKTLGPEYLVWDKAATIRFLRPGRETLHATFRLEMDQVDVIRAEVDRAGAGGANVCHRAEQRAGQVHATCEKLLSIRRRKGTSAAEQG